MSIIEKPIGPLSNYAVTELYFVDETVPECAREIMPYARGEAEITSLLEMYLHKSQLDMKRIGSGYAWLNTRTHGSLLDAGNCVYALETHQGQQTECLKRTRLTTAGLTAHSAQSRHINSTKTIAADIWRGY